MPMSPRLLRPIASNLDKDAATYLNAVAVADGQQLEPAVKKAINDFVKGCKQDGIWDAIKASCILAGARTLTGALVPLKGTAPTNNNFVSGDYDRETGLLGNVTTKFLNSNRAGNADPQDSFHVAVYASTVASSGVRVYAGSGLNAAGAFNFFIDGGTAITFRNRTAGSSSFAGGASATGLIGTSRGSSASYVSRAGGASQTNTVASETPVSQNIFIYALNNSGASFHANARLAFYSIGESINLALLDARVAALVRGLRPQAANADAQDWIDRVYNNGGAVSASTASAVNTFCNAIDAAGIRDRFYRLNLFAGTGLSACLVPLYRGQSRTGTQFGNATDTNNGPFVSGDYNETGTSSGLLGAATKYLNTGVKANDLTQSDRHLSVVADASSLGLGSQYSIGGDNFGAGGNYYWGILAGSTAANMMVRAQASAVNSTQFSVTGKPHVILSGNGSATVYRNGSSVVTGPAGAFTAPAQDIWVLGLNRAGSLADVYNGRISSYSIGLAFTASQALSYYNAISAFQTALSRA